MSRRQTMSRCRTMLEIDRKREITGLERVASYHRPSKKLSHRRLGPYPVERRIGKYAYRWWCQPSAVHEIHKHNDRSEVTEGSEWLCRCKEILEEVRFSPVDSTGLRRTHCKFSTNLAESGQSGGVQWSPVQSAGLQPDYVGERKVLLNQ